MKYPISFNNFFTWDGFGFNAGRHLVRKSMRFGRRKKEEGKSVFIRLDATTFGLSSRVGFIFLLSH